MQTTREWKALSSYEGIRHRTEMYFGSREPHSQKVIEYENYNLSSIKETTWIPAVSTAFREIIDNSIDELITHGFGDQLHVSYDTKHNIFEVSDNGRGIPIDWDEEHQDYAASVLLSHIHSGRNFNDETRGETRGVNGVGAKGTNFTSEWFEVEIHRDNKSFEMRFRESSEKEIIRDEPIIFPMKSKETGTTIRFKLSEKVFSSGIILPETFIKSRVFEIALCYPKLKVFYNNEQIKIKSPDQIFKDMKPIKFSINASNLNSNFWLLPSFIQDGSEYAHTLVNAICVFNGGTHIEAFRKGFYLGLLAGLEKESKKRKLEPNKSDVVDGLLIYNITQMSAPTFDSQAKTRLINQNVANIIKKEMDNPEFFRKVIKENPEWIESIYEKCQIRTNEKDDKELKKLAKSGKKQKVEGLSDAVGADRSKCILLLAEGVSAISGALEERNPQIHGGLPLRGKPMNAKKATMKELMLDDTMKNIMNSIGLVPGERVNRRMLRYGSIWLTMDSDEDGKNIAALLINFFYAYWAELFDSNLDPFIYIFDTPLIIAVKGKTRKYWYSSNYSDFDPEKHKGWEITRAKGLAALKREDWKYALANPKTIPIRDDGKLSEVLDLLFNTSRADDRKTLIALE